jgi:hypothetical protein
MDAENIGNRYSHKKLAMESEAPTSLPPVNIKQSDAHPGLSQDGLPTESAPALTTVDVQRKAAIAKKILKALPGILSGKKSLKGLSNEALLALLSDESASIRDRR